MNVIMVFTDESNDTFLSKDKRDRADVKTVAIRRVADFMDDIDDELATALFSTTESEYPVFRRIFQHAQAI